MQLSEIDQVQVPPADKLVALFISDTHLEAGSPHTAEAFFDFLDRFGKQADQLYLLGDLFEYWAGDDDRDAPFNARVVAALRALSDAGVMLFWMAGNRDFLVGSAFMQATGATPLADPSVAVIAGQRMVLTHGDAQCTDDVDYQAFRTTVRTPEWQQAFMDMPLAKRLAVIGQMREQSRAAQKTKVLQIMDVNVRAITGLFAATGTSLMIHGHTHRPGTHELEMEGRRVIRHVLPDWDFENGNMRGGGIAIYANGTVASLSACR